MHFCTPQHITSRQYRAKPQRSLKQSVYQIEQSASLQATQNGDRTLNTLGYTGIREFSRSPRRDAAREQDMIYDRAHELYTRLQKAGIPHHKLASLIGEVVKVPPRTIRRWANNTDWRLITDKVRNIRRNPMYVKTQFETIVNLAYYSKIKIDYLSNTLINDSRLEYSISLNSNQLRMAVDGIYIIWTDTTPRSILKVGSGQIKYRLREHFIDPTVQPYKRYNIYVTWATIPWADRRKLTIDQYTDRLRGIEKFIGFIFPPKLTENLPVNVDLVLVNIPELETSGQTLLNFTGRYRQV